MTNSLHRTLGFSGPQQVLTSALPVSCGVSAPVVLSAYGVAVPAQLQVLVVRLGETDDVRNLLADAPLQFISFPFRRAPFDVLVQQFHSHGGVA